jgi:hypothetical protein
LNPPYKQPEIEQFSEKYAAHVRAGDIRAGIVLVNNATDTQCSRRSPTRLMPFALRGLDAATGNLIARRARRSKGRSLCTPGLIARGSASALQTSDSYWCGHEGTG